MDNYQNNPTNLQSLSLEYEVFWAIKKRFEKEKIKVYNLQAFDDIEKLNQILLPSIKDIIAVRELTYYTKSLAYDLDKFSITKYFNHDKDQISIELKYFEFKFKLKILFDNSFNDHDYASGIVIFLEKVVIEKIALFQWNTDFINLDQISLWVQNALQKKSLDFKINHQTLTVETKKINIFSIDYEELTKKIIKINFIYNNAIIKACLIKLSDWITNHDLIKSFEDFFQKKFIIDLPMTVNYKNFWKEFKSEQHLQKIYQLLANNNFKVRETIIDFPNDTFRFGFSNDKTANISITPWTRIIKLPMVCNLNETNLSFDINFRFTVPIDYQEIKANFVKKMQRLNILTSQFLNQPASKIKTIIKQQIVSHFNGKLSIDNKDYSFDLNQMLIDNFQVDSQEQLVININEKLVDNQTINLVCNIKDFKPWIVNEVINYLAQFGQKNPFDLKKQLTEENTWNDVFKLVRDSIKFHYFHSSLIAKIIFVNVYSNDLSVKIKDDNFETYQLYKVIKITYQNTESKQIEIDFKNLVISQDFKDINELSRSINSNFISRWNNIYPIWKVGEKIDDETLGISIYNQDKNIKINYWIRNINEIDGKVQITTIFTKNLSSKTLIFNVSGFLTKLRFIQIIKDFFARDFTYSHHQFWTKEPRQKAHSKIKNLLKDYLYKNYPAISSIEFLSDGNDLITNYELKSGDNFRLKINLKEEIIELTFKAINIKDTDIFNFVETFDKNQTYNYPDIYPGFILDREFQSFPFELKIPNNPEKLLLTYQAISIDYNQGIVNLFVNVKHQVLIKEQLKVVSQDQFKMTIHGFGNDEMMKKKLLSLNKSYPYEVHKLSTNDLRMQAQESVKTIIKNLVGVFSYQGLSDIAFEGNQAKALVNTRQNHGDIVECKISFGNVRQLNIKINFANIFEGDVLNLLELFEINQITTKKDFYIKDWHAGYAVNHQDLGINQPRDLLGCSVLYEIATINPEQGTLKVEVLIRKKFSKHLFFININGYGKPLEAKKFIGWIEQISANENALKVGLDVNEALDLTTNTAEDAFELIKHQAVPIFGNNDHLHFEINKLNVVNNLELNHKSLLKLFLLETNEFISRVKIRYQIINNHLIDTSNKLAEQQIFDNNLEIKDSAEILYLKNWKH